MCGLILLAPIVAAPVGAQSFPADLPESWMSSWPDGPPATGLVPSIWVDRRGLGFTVGGTLAIDLERSIALVPGAPFGGVILELGAYGSGATLRSPRSASSLSARFHIARRTSGVWLASSGFTSEDDGRALPAIGTGLWIQRGRFTFTTQVMHLLDPLRVPQRSTVQPAEPDSERVAAIDRSFHVPVDDVRLLNGAEASVAWALDCVELQTRVGVAMGQHRRSARWGEIGAAYWPRPRLALFARARGAADVPTALEVVRGSRVALGIQVAPGRSSGASTRLRAALDRRFRLERAGGAEHRICLRIPGERLEVRSDATGWNSIEAQRLGSDRWEVVLTMSPGIHRIEIRIDGGAWRPPPGVPTAADDFGGEVGLIVVD